MGGLLIILKTAYITLGKVNNSEIFSAYIDAENSQHSLKSLRNHQIRGEQRHSLRSGMSGLNHPTPHPPHSGPAHSPTNP